LEGSEEVYVDVFAGQLLDEEGLRCVGGGGGGDWSCGVVLEGSEEVFVNVFAGQLLDEPGLR
jgi:hypothetical protein